MLSFSIFVRCFMSNDPLPNISFCSDDTAYPFSPLTYHPFLVGFEAFINRFANKNFPVLDHYNGCFGSSRQLLYSNFFRVTIFNQILARRYIDVVYAANEKKIECD